MAGSLYEIKGRFPACGFFRYNGNLYPKSNLSNFRCGDELQEPAVGASAAIVSKIRRYQFFTVKKLHSALFHLTELPIALSNFHRFSVWQTLVKDAASVTEGSEPTLAAYRSKVRTADLVAVR